MKRLGHVGHVVSRVGLGALLASTVVLAPAGAYARTTPPGVQAVQAADGRQGRRRPAAAASCTGPVVTAVKAGLHTAATPREATLTQLAGVLQPRPTRSC